MTSRIGVKRVAIGSDHAGFDLKTHLTGVLEGLGYHVEDYGTGLGCAPPATKPARCAMSNIM